MGLSQHFPARFGGADSEALLYYQQQQKRLLALCRYIATGAAQHLELLTSLDEWLLDQTKPEIFDDDSPANVLTQYRRRFGRLCAALAEQGYPSPQLLPLFDFHQAVDYLTQKHEAA